MAQRILVVEDEPAIAENISYALRTEGFEVVWCQTAADARAALDGDGVALMVLDIGLPDENGFDLCRDVRSGSELPIVFVTARSEEVDRIVGLEIGGDDYVVKPFSPRELSARVRAVLRRARPEAAAAPVPFQVDTRRMVISYHGTPLALSRYEFRLLKLFVDRPGWVFSREQIMEQVWEEPEASLDRTVDTHIKTLRAKLRALRPDVNAIRTHRGLGYSLRDDL